MLFNESFGYEFRFDFDINVAERWGFEPQIRYRMLPFQGSAIDHSAISPRAIFSLLQ